MKSFFCIILVSYSSITYSQIALNILDLNHEPLKGIETRLVSANPQIGDHSFHMNVGGISFQGVASPAERIKNDPVSLDIEGGRFVVRIGSNTTYPDLPLWQLIPIVNYANSPYSVVFSQTGDATGSGGARCRFHPAFLDNLLGLRLFQADLLNMSDVIWDLPVDNRRNYVLAPSEKDFKPARDLNTRQIIHSKLLMGDFTSFVLTDKDVNYYFDTDERGLKFLGQPYYYFTKTEMNKDNIQKLRTQVIECYNDIDKYAGLLLKEEYTPALNPRTNLDSLVKILNKYEREKVKIFNAYSLHYLTQAIVKLDSLNSMKDEDIGIRFSALNAYTESFASTWEILKKYSPVVYTAVENAAQWSAFFRYARQSNADNWSQFVKKIETEAKSDAPAVKTPDAIEINYLRYFEEREKSK